MISTQHARLRMILIVAVLCAYIAAYKFLLVPVTYVTEAHLGFARGYREPSFKYGGRLSEVIFAPAVFVDRCIRPDYWNSRDFQLK